MHKVSTEVRILKKTHYVQVCIGHTSRSFVGDMTKVPENCLITDIEHDAFTGILTLSFLEEKEE